MTRRLVAWIAIAVLALRAFAALPAGDLGARAVPGMGEICSAGAVLSAPGAAEPGAPPTPRQSHLPSHCADCLACALVAVLPAAMAQPERRAEVLVVAFSPATTAPIGAAAALLPPPRGPPAKRHSA